jgi:hypothetical protein
MAIIGSKRMCKKVSEQTREYPSKYSQSGITMGGMGEEEGIVERSSMSTLVLLLMGKLAIISVRHKNVYL